MERIKAVPGEVTFLVVDQETDAHYRDNKIIITGDMDNVERIGGEVEETAADHGSEPVVTSAPDDAEVDEVAINSQPEQVEHVEEADEVQEVAAFAATGRSAAVCTI